MKNLFKYSFGFYLLLILTTPLEIRAQEFLIPQTAVVQHAGSIGYFSIGAGYSLFRNKNGSLDILWGYVPKSKGGSQHILSPKFAYRPLNFKIKNFGTIHALNPGVFVAYYPGNTFYNEVDYPKGYYWWSSTFRFHLSLSTEVKFKLPENLSVKGIKHFSVYSEFNTNDLYFVSWAKNQRELPFKRIVRLGFGVKAYF